MPNGLLVRLGLGVAAIFVLPFLLIAGLLAALFDASFLWLALVPVLIGAGIAFALSRKFKGLMQMTQGGNPALKSTGTKLLAIVENVRPMPSLARGGQPKAMHAVSLQIKNREGTIYRAPAFHSGDAGATPPRAGDNVTVYVAIGDAAQMFVDWASLKRGPDGANIIDGEILSRGEEVTPDTPKRFMPANDRS